jgi:hypothetical protein
MDEWEKTARRFGLNLVAKEFVGFPNLPFSHSTVLGVLAFETPRLLASGFTARTTAAPASGSGGLTKPHHGLPSAA